MSVSNNTLVAREVERNAITLSYMQHARNDCSRYFQQTSRIRCYGHGRIEYSRVRLFRWVIEPGFRS